jgi:hypothetical protein
VNIDQGGNGEVTTNAKNENVESVSMESVRQGDQLGRKIGGVVRDVIRDEQRPGGLLDKS